jgi:hypothetical protein
MRARPPTYLEPVLRREAHRLVGPAGHHGAVGGHERDGPEEPARRAQQLMRRLPRDAVRLRQPVGFRLRLRTVWEGRDLSDGRRGLGVGATDRTRESEQMAYFKIGERKDVMAEK